MLKCGRRLNERAELVEAGSCSGLCALCIGLLAGGCPAASNFGETRKAGFLLFAKRRATRAGFAHFAQRSYANTKVTKEKATLAPASLRFATGNLRCSVQPGSKTTRFAQTSFCPDPSGPALLGASTRVGAVRRNTKQPDTNTEYLKKQGLAVASPCLSWFDSLVFVLCPRSRSRLPRPGWAEERRDKRIRAGVV